MTRLPQSTIEAMRLIAKTQFRPFDKNDWMAWSGCNTEEPFIGEFEDIVVILDGDAVVFNRYSEDDVEWTIFNLSYSDESY